MLWVGSSRRLITPTNGIILDPFMGSGSTGKGALLEGFDFIGIEKEKEYFNIAEKRIKYTYNNIMEKDENIIVNVDNETTIIEDKKLKMLF